jgi:glycosyltransferase involved in cell wall biosynthesis
MGPCRIVLLVENMSFPRDPRVRKEAYALSAAGCNVTVICPKSTENTKGFEVIDGVNVHRYWQPWHGGGVFGYLLEYSWAMLCTFGIVVWVWMRDGFDVLHAANPPDLFFLIAAPFKLLRKKFVYDQHDFCPELLDLKFGRRAVLRRIALLFERCSFSLADLAIVTNQSAHEIALKRGGVPPQRLRIVRNGPDLDRFRSVPPRPDLKGGAAYLAVYLGTIAKQDGVDRIVRAVHHIVHRRGRKDVTFAVLGDGDCIEQVKQLARSLNVEPHIRFAGWVGNAELLAYLSTADVCLSPDAPVQVNQLSTFIKIMEYMACSRAIVSFDLKESRRSAGAAAIYVEKDDLALFGDAILEILDDPIRREELGRVGLERVKKYLHWGLSRDRLLEAYQQMICRDVRLFNHPEHGPVEEVEPEICTMNDCLCQYYRCPEQYISLALKGSVSEDAGYFRFGQDILYGRISGGRTVARPIGDLRDMLPECSIEGRTLYLPFDATEVVDGLRNEAYANSSGRLHPASSLLSRAYYFIRPALPVKIRRLLQKIRLAGWRQLPFPKWPVDRTVDNTLESLLLLSLKSQRVQQIPFIWFWPNGASSCAILTHDVEATAGLDFCSPLMDIDDSFGVKASFQIIPEGRYEIPAGFLDAIRRRGFEVNVQDLNHDGLLFRDREEFRARATKINRYGREFGAGGFRSAVLYRRQQWYDALRFSYDMSVPNVAHLDPQRGGCCTVMPYFIGNILELPVTMTQDYSLFHVLNDHSINLWKRQSELVMANHGLLSFIVHPDYIIDKPERTTYESLLAYLVELRSHRNLWMPLPGEVASWWRERSQMRLVEVNGTWQIEGKGKERARIAYASEKDGQLVFSFESVSNPGQPPELNSARHAETIH